MTGRGLHTQIELEVGKGGGNISEGYVFEGGAGMWLRKRKMC